MRLIKTINKAISRNIAEIKKIIWDNKQSHIIVDSTGSEYARHEVNAKIFGYAIESAYFRLSDENPENVLLITLLGGIFGMHHIIRGDYKSGLIYLLTGGGFGILYLSDVMSICCGNYSYIDVSYENDDKRISKRNKEKIYLRPLKGIKIKVISIVIAIILAITAIIFLWAPIYRTLEITFTDFIDTGVNSYINSMYMQ